MRSSGVLPPRETAERLIRIFELEKAVYELGYELAPPARLGWDPRRRDPAPARGGSCMKVASPRRRTGRRTRPRDAPRRARRAHGTAARSSCARSGPTAERCASSPRAVSPWSSSVASGRPLRGPDAARRSCRSATGSRSTYPGDTVVQLEDPYSFLPTLGDLDLHLAAQGRHEQLYNALGAHVREMNGVTGTAFAVGRRPRARSASSATSTCWDGRLHQMRSLGGSGIWELFLPGVGEGACYKLSCGAPTAPFACTPTRCTGDRGAAEQVSVSFRSRYQGARRRVARRAGGVGGRSGDRSRSPEVHLGSSRQGAPPTATRPSSSASTAATSGSPTSSCCRS